MRSTVDRQDGDRVSRHRKNGIATGRRPAVNGKITRFACDSLLPATAAAAALHARTPSSIPCRPTPSPTLKLPHGLAFADLYSADGAARIDALFVAHLQAADAALAARLAAARAKPEALERKGESELLIALGPHLEDFLAALFGIEGDVRTLEAKHHELAPLYAVKRLFVQRKAMNTHQADVAATFDGAALRRELERALGAPFTELGFAKRGGALAAGREPRTPRRSTSRCATPPGRRTRPRAAPRTRAACCSARRASSTT